MIRLSIIILLLLSFLFLITNSSSLVNNENSDEFLFVTTDYILYDFTKNIVKDKAEIILLLNTEQDIHDWEPRISDIQTISHADVLIYNGLLLEPFIKKLVVSADNRNLILINSTEGLFTNDDRGIDPHVWVNPIFSKHQVSQISNILIQSYPSDKQFYLDNSTSYLSQIDNLDIEIKKSISKLDSKNFLECHTGIKYFAIQYGLNSYNILGDEKYHPHNESSLSSLNYWINFAKNTEISVIFADPVHCKKLSQTLSNELNLKIIYLSSPMEAVSNDDVTYFSEMRKYSNIIINALM